MFSHKHWNLRSKLEQNILMHSENTIIKKRKKNKTTWPNIMPKINETEKSKGGLK